MKIRLSRQLYCCPNVGGLAGFYCIRKKRDHRLSYPMCSVIRGEVMQVPLYIWKFSFPIWHIVTCPSGNLRLQVFGKFKSKTLRQICELPQILGKSVHFWQFFAHFSMFLIVQSICSLPCIEYRVKNPFAIQDSHQKSKMAATKFIFFLQFRLINFRKW